MGDKSLAFVSNSITVTQNKPEVLPGNFNTGEFEKDYRLSVALIEVLGLLEQLSWHAKQVGSRMMMMSTSTSFGMLVKLGYQP